MHTCTLSLTHTHTGQKFPSKSLEVSLQATVHFHENPVLSASDDPFCTGLNAYIDVSARVSVVTINGNLSNAAHSAIL